MSRPVIVVLAGGQASRMGGGDKGLRPLAGATVLDHLLARLAGQGDRIVISANGDPGRFSRFGLPVIADEVIADEVGAGPLAGMLAGMEWARRHRPATTDILTVPTDTPFLPADLVERLWAGRREADIAVAVSAGRRHPVIALQPLRLAAALRAAVIGGQVRKVGLWLAGHTTLDVDFPVGPVDPFFNINHPADLTEAERFVASLRDHGEKAPGRDGAARLRPMH